MFVEDCNFAMRVPSASSIMTRMPTGVRPLAMSSASTDPAVRPASATAASIV